MDLRRKDSLFICLSVLIVQVVCQQVELSPESHHVDKKVFENPALHHVVVHFMDLKRTDFLNFVPGVKQSIASALSRYCLESNCGFVPHANFTANDVGFVGNNEKEKFVEEGRFVVGKVYARVPASAQRSVDGDENNNNDDDDNEDELILDERDNVADAQTKVLSKSLVQEVLTKYRDQIVRESGVQVAYIESKLVYPPRDNFDNFLIIPISCAFCIAILIFNLVCQHKSRKLEMESKVTVTGGKTSGGGGAIYKGEKLSSPNDQAASSNLLPKAGGAQTDASTSRKAHVDNGAGKQPRYASTETTKTNNELDGDVNGSSGYLEPTSAHVQPVPIRHLHHEQQQQRPVSSAGWDPSTPVIKTTRKFTTSSSSHTAHYVHVTQV